MTAALFLAAIAEKLRLLFPERQVFVDAIPADAVGHFLVRCIKQSHAKKLDRRRERAYQFEILFYPPEPDSMTFYDWAETLYREMEDLVVEGQVFHLKNCSASDGGDGVLHFLCEAAFTFLLPPQAEEKMEQLSQNNEVK